METLLTRPSTCSGLSVSRTPFTKVPLLATNDVPLTSKSLIRVTESPSAKGAPLLSTVRGAAAQFAVVGGAGTQGGFESGIRHGFFPGGPIGACMPPATRMGHGQGDSNRPAPERPVLSWFLKFSTAGRGLSKIRCPAARQTGPPTDGSGSRFRCGPAPQIPQKTRQWLRIPG